MQETWKPILGYEMYEASNFGRVRRIHILKPCLHTKGKRGYLHLVLCKSPQNHKHIFVHDAVLSAFTGQKPKGFVVNHIDGHRTNNALSNLQYVTKRENYDHAIKLGLYKKGSWLKHSKLKESDIPIIRHLYKQGMSGIKIAKRYHVSFSALYNLLRGKSWKHIS